MSDVFGEGPPPIAPGHFWRARPGYGQYLSADERKADRRAPSATEAAVRDGDKGTFACPICGYDKPHSHTEAEQIAYREDQLRNDGWTSVAKQNPKQSGWYLCSDIDIPRDQGVGFRNSQLSWFLWVRDGKANPIEQVPEVLHFDHAFQMWTLRNLLGDAVPSGAESRWRVIAHPRYWRLAAASPAKQPKGERG